MKILVSGGAGFIGSHVADRYIADGYQVIVIDNFITGKMENLNPRAHFYQMDILDGGIEEIFVRERPEVVNHHAAQIDVRKSVQDPLFDAKTNVLGTLNLLEKSVKYRVRQFLFASSGGAIYGDQPEGAQAASEDDSLRPISPYGVAKAAAELYLHYYRVVHGLNFVALRYGNVYGPRQDPFGEAGVVAIFTEKLLSGGQPLINGDGLQTRDYVYVEDAAEANVLALNSKASGPFNIGTGIEKNVNELFGTLLRIAGKSVPEVHGPPKPGEQRRSVLNCSKAHAHLGWAPKFSFESGLHKTVEYFEKLHRRERGEGRPLRTQRAPR
ncbi:MAG: NAD-dependent epimerase/dehydratase family protein [Deltaproteobacteria bacterium]|nr:NAD-dependent epimerase/dehydratase family protein [Deltaproteobacteria bacterium]